MNLQLTSSRSRRLSRSFEVDIHFHDTINVEGLKTFFMLSYCIRVTIDDESPPLTGWPPPDPGQPRYSRRTCLSTLPSAHFSDFSFNLSISVTRFFSLSVRHNLYLLFHGAEHQMHHATSVSTLFPSSFLSRSDYPFFSYINVCVGMVADLKRPVLSER